MLAARRPQHGDVTLIPTTPLQQTAIILNFFFPALALAVVSLRCYSRLRFNQFGLGKCAQSEISYLFRMRIVYNLPTNIFIIKRCCAMNVVRVFLLTIVGFR